MIKHGIFYIRMKILTHELPTTIKICTFNQRSRPCFLVFQNPKWRKTPYLP